MGNLVSKIIEKSPCLGDESKRKKLQKPVLEQREQGSFLVLNTRGASDR